ncbi:glycerophosphodiester phosphodiesterase [Flavobacterium silvaticum]|uniref:Glycerophosphodiester phosphodiesterase n=1 Tax=Flavobacterium silvaticum TaxID=1852020 RepID=A0A972FJK8_9FLAO|nr:glycerophosphodiester phosphodiesterase family protein [Flavobacterium silvaticum]NMH27151.1 glycerophosphodiester phosphodiesterase [Flavobacterium silvaticum]
MKKIAHRGAKGHTSENTIAAFGMAIDMGSDGIELDVHLSSDGELIVFHDETTDRLTGQSGHIESFDSKAIAALNVDGLHPIPTLREALDFIGTNCFINIELKTEKTVVPVIELLTDLVSNGADYNQYLVSCFDWSALQYIHDKMPQIPLGVLTETDLDLAIGFAKTIKATAIHPYFHLLTRENVTNMQQLGFKVYTWTVNEFEDLERMKSFGVDGIITDFPDRL